MSLRGRLLIDKAKRAVSNYFTLPVPPYGNPNYWDGCYRSLGPDDSFEWGNISFEDLQTYSYRNVKIDRTKPDQPLTCNGVSLETTLGETLDAYPEAPSDENIVMLGCGNSKFGESMIDHGWRGPIVQVDISSRVIESMSQRCQERQRAGDMVFIQDDATELSSFNDNKAKAVFDKGLVDALFCANEYEQCRDVLQSVQRVLEPNGIYACLSFSEPRFLFDKLTDSSVRYKDNHGWKKVEVRQLSSIFLYRFQKAPREKFTIKAKHSQRRR